MRTGWNTGLMVLMALPWLGRCTSNDGEGGGYDARYDCEELAVCLDQRGAPVSDEQVNECVADSAAGYRGLSASRRREFDDAFATCGDLTSCDYSDCFEGELGLAPTCTGALTPSTGTVPSSAGTFAFNEAEAQLWVNNEGCLTEIDVVLHSGQCSVEFSGEGLLDAEGRYLITRVWIRTSGLCPGYPDDLSGLLLQQATDQPFGTIEVNRTEENWLQCAATDLIIKPTVSFERFDATPIVMSDFTLSFSGSLSRTHLSLDASCPTLFF